MEQEWEANLSGLETPGLLQGHVLLHLGCYANPAANSTSVSDAPTLGTGTPAQTSTSRSGGTELEQGSEGPLLGQILTL